MPVYFLVLISIISILFPCTFIYAGNVDYNDTIPFDKFIENIIGFEIGIIVLLCLGIVPIFKFLVRIPKEKKITVLKYTVIIFLCFSVITPVVFVTYLEKKQDRLKKEITNRFCDVVAKEKGCFKNKNEEYGGNLFLSSGDGIIWRIFDKYNEDKVDESKYIRGVVTEKDNESIIYNNQGISYKNESNPFNGNLYEQYFKIFWGPEKEVWFTKNKKNNGFITEPAIYYYVLKPYVIKFHKPKLIKKSYMPKDRFGRYCDLEPVLSIEDISKISGLSHYIENTAIENFKSYESFSSIGGFDWMENEYFYIGDLNQNDEEIWDLYDIIEDNPYDFARVRKYDIIKTNEFDIIFALTNMQKWGIKEKKRIGESIYHTQRRLYIEKFLKYDFIIIMIILFLYLISNVYAKKIKNVNKCLLER